MQNSWFQVDKDGLSKLIDERGKAFVVYELVQNAWDTNAANVSVRLEKLPGRPFAELTVIDDDPDGFHDLAHAYTLFAESVKKGDPTKRGRFNLGEKLVLALCKSARVESTSGTVVFNEDGSMSRSKKKTDKGSVFQAIIRMNQTEYDEVCEAMFKLIPPDGKTTLFNGEEILPFSDGSRVTEFETILPTVISNEAGVLVRSKRKTWVRVYETNGKPAWIYEMGIPVVETGDKYHVDVGQKVPLNMDRDNVPPGFLKKVRAEVLNRTAAELSKEEASESWVTNALESEDVSDEAVSKALDQRFGKKRAIYDPSDPEANMTLTSQGYNVVHGGSLPKAAWGSVKRSGAALPSGQIRPTPKPFSDDPDAPTMEEIPRSEWTQGMKEVEEILRWFAQRLEIHKDLLVRFGLPPKRRDYQWKAAWGGGFTWNVTVMGRKWFDEWDQHPQSLLNTMIHEFAHTRASNHLDDGFHRACTDLGAKVALLCLHDGKRIPHFRKLTRRSE